MENFSFNFNDYLVIPVIIACCMIGFLIKNFTGIKNKYIPGILLAFGAIINCAIMLSDGSKIAITTILYGAVSGLASSGIYDFFIKALLNKSKEVEKQLEDNIINKIKEDNAIETDTSDDASKDETKTDKTE